MLPTCRFVSYGPRVELYRLREARMRPEPGGLRALIHFQAFLHV
jgi:hypothetical protein